MNSACTRVPVARFTSSKVWNSLGPVILAPFTIRRPFFGFFFFFLAAKESKVSKVVLRDSCSSNIGRRSYLSFFSKKS